MHYDKIKRFTDRYPVAVPIKGGAVNSLADLVIMTSNVHIAAWWPGTLSESDYNAILRRVKIFKFPEEKESAEDYLIGKFPDIEIRKTW